MVKDIITNISEEDFRKLDLKVYRSERVVVSENIPGHPVCRFEMVERSLNEIIDKEIESIIAGGYRSDMEFLQLPLTIAIHEPYTADEYNNVREKFKGMTDDECHMFCIRACSYLDKFMNQFTGSQTFQLGWGIKHLYSTRDYYEARDDYWRVSKKETKVIYRIKLSPEWLNKFVLKHRTETIDWPYDVLPDGVSPDYTSAALVIHYDLQPDGSWKENGREAQFEYLRMKSIIPVDKDGKKIEPEWKKNSYSDVNSVK